MKRRRPEGQRPIDAFLKSPRASSPAGSESGSEIGAGSPASQSRFATCPICGSSFPFYAVAQHVASHDGEEKHAEAASATALQLTPSTPSSAAAAQQRGMQSPSARNAFSEMLSSAKTKFTPKKCHARFMLAYQDGAFLPVFIMNSGSEAAEQLEAALPESSWSCVVEIRSFVDKSSLTLNLCTNIPSESGDGLTRRDGMPPSLMKSMIQKACRLCNPNAAAYLSLELLRISPDEVLRRLSIIALEDGCLHPATPVLIWLMIAMTKDYKPPINLYRAVVRMAAEIAAVKWKEPVPSDAFAIDTVDMMQLLQDAQQQAEEANDLSRLYSSTLVASILMRVSYGGMAFDMQMLRKFAVAWMKRFNGTYELPAESAGEDEQQQEQQQRQQQQPQQPPGVGLTYLSPVFTRRLSDTYYGRLIYEAYAPINLSEHLDEPMASALSSVALEDAPDDTRTSLRSPLLRLQASHLILSGVDFHVSDVVNQVLQRTPAQKLHELKHLLSADDSQLQNYIRMAMWHFRSSINHKKVWPLPPGEVEVYKQDMRDDAKKKSMLAPLWSAIRGVVMAYSEQHLQRQFARVQALT